MTIVSLYDFSNPAMPDLRLNHSKLGAVHLKAFGPEDEPTSVFVAHQYALCEALYYDALKTQGPTSNYFRICAAYLNKLNVCWKHMLEPRRTRG